MIPERLWAPPALNPLTKVAVTVGISSLAFTVSGRGALYPSICISSLIVVASGLAMRSARPALKAVALAAAVALAEYLGSRRGFVGALALIVAFLNTGVRMIPAILLGYWLATSIRVSDFLASADRCGLPRVVSIPLAVALRYLPTVASENAQIRMAMRTRGMRGGVRGFIRRPLAALEEALVPLLLRAATVADELAASAITRGLDTPKRRTYARPSALGALDALAAAGAIAFAILVIRAAADA